MNFVYYTQKNNIMLINNKKGFVLNNLTNDIFSEFSIHNLSCDLRKNKIDDWRYVINNTEYTSTKYCNSFVEFVFEVFDKNNLLDLSLIVYENKKPVSIIPLFFDKVLNIFFYERYKNNADTIIDPIFISICSDKIKDKIYNIFFSILKKKVKNILHSTTFCNNFQPPYWYINKFDSCNFYEKKHILYLELAHLELIQKKLKLSKKANDKKVHIVHKNEDKKIWNQVRQLHINMHGPTRTSRSWDLQEKAIQEGDAFLSYILDDNYLSAANFFYITKDESRYAMSVSDNNVNNYYGVLLHLESLKFIKSICIKWHFLGTSSLDFKIEEQKKINIAKFKEKFSTTTIIDYHYKIE